ncbi:polysaccharide biosynthesis C-terminal domain-containing protein, partial [Patescibacteria group bacterium]|nr:polysaccharide biosynthesis C-terminal domain-containing protein [Patescibacteria group bacterium]
KNILNTSFTKIISAGLSLILLILTTRYLGAHGRGVLSIITASVGLITLFNGFLGGSSLVYVIPRNRSISFFKQATILWCLWSLLVSILISFILLFTGVISTNLFFHIVILGILSSFFGTSTTILLAEEKVGSYNISGIIQVSANFLIFGLIILVLRKVNINSYLLALYISYILGLCFTVYFVLKIWKVVRKKPLISFFSTVKEISRYGFIAQLGNVIQYLNYRLSYFILNHYVGLADVGIYSVGVTIAESIRLISSSIALVQYSKIANTDNLNYSRELTIRLAKLSFIITLLATFFLLFMPQGLFSLVFGRDFGPTKTIIFYLSAGIVSFGLTVTISHYFAGIGKYHINTIASFIGLVFTIALNFLLIPKYGYIGAAISASLSYLGTSLFLILIFIKETGYSLLIFLPSKQDLKFIVDRIELRYLRESRNIQLKHRVSTGVDKIDD